MAETKISTCKRHGSTTYAKSGRHYKCRKCAVEAVLRRRRKVKKALVKYMGGECEMCGYNKYVGALEFHHKNPSEKDFGLSRHGHSISMKRAIAEADKCMLLCANCHREIHSELNE